MMMPTTSPLHPTSVTPPSSRAAAAPHLNHALRAPRPWTLLPAMMPWRIVGNKSGSESTGGPGGGGSGGQGVSAMKEGPAALPCPEVGSMERHPSNRSESSAAETEQNTPDASPRSIIMPSAASSNASSMAARNEDDKEALRAAILSQKLAAVGRQVASASFTTSSDGAGMGDGGSTSTNMSTIGSSGSSSGNSASAAARKRALQKVKESIFFGGKRQVLSARDREALVERWGDKLQKVEEEAFHLFSSLDSQQVDGQLQAAEFKACLGAMGGGVTMEFPQVLFSAIDKNNSGSISFVDFVNWLLTMTHGTDDEKLRYGFDLCDQNKDGRIDKADLLTTIQNMFQVLTGLNLPPNDVCVHRFTDTVFTSLGQAKSGSISWEAFKAGAKSIETFLRTLGSRDVSCYHTPCSRKRGAGDVVFGSQKWRFITTMMLGLEFAVRGVEKQKVTLEQQASLLGSPQASPKGGGNVPGPGPPLALGHLLPLGGGGGGGGIVRGDSTVSSGEGSSAGGDTLRGTGGSGGGGRAAGSTISSASASGYLERLRQDLQTRSCTKEVFLIPTSDGSRCQIASYGAEPFRAVRRSCGICDDDFLLSVGIRQVIGSLLLGDLFGLSEQVSEGKSGSFFYWSQDGKFMVKTISRAESYQMRRMLPAYTDHLATYPETLLMRILGLYRLKLNNDKWDLIIIQNIFGTSHGIHERFDLKGSTHERTVGARNRALPGIVMKDKDFLELGRKIHVGPKLSERLKMQVKIDSQFLARYEVLDYSLLVGVHYVDRGPPEDIWVAQQGNALEALYGDFRRLLRSHEHERPRFFQKEFDFERFAHYAYLHHHFDKAASLSLVPPSPRVGHGVDGPTAPAMDPHHGIRAYRSPQEQQDGEPDQLLFFGIIDLLVPFDSRKKGEYVLKSVYHKGRQDFSVIPPKDYRERFVRFVCDAIV